MRKDESHARLDRTIPLAPVRLRIYRTAGCGGSSGWAVRLLCGETTSVLEAVGRPARLRREDRLRGQPNGVGSLEQSALGHVKREPANRTDALRRMRPRIFKTFGTNRRCPRYGEPTAHGPKRATQHRDTIRKVIRSGYSCAMALFALPTTWAHDERLTPEERPRLAIIRLRQRCARQLSGRSGRSAVAVAAAGARASWIRGDAGRLV